MLRDAISEGESLENQLCVVRLLRHMLVLAACASLRHISGDYARMPCGAGGARPCSVHREPRAATLSWTPLSTDARARARARTILCALVCARLRHSVCIATVTVPRRVRPEHSAPFHDLACCHVIDTAYTAQPHLTCGHIPFGCPDPHTTPPPHLRPAPAPHTPIATPSRHLT